MRIHAKNDQAIAVERVRNVPTSGDCLHSIVTIEGELGLVCTGRADTRASIADALAASAKVSHEHTLQPADCWTEGDSLVALYRAPQSTLAEATAKGDLTDGAAVTVLVPVLGALEAMHANGVAGAELGFEHIRIDASGAPLVWMHGTRVCTDAPTPHWRRTEPLVERDLRALEELMAGLLSDRESLPDSVYRAMEARRWADTAEALLEWRQPIALSAIVERGDERSAPLVRKSRRQLRSATKKSVRWAPGVDAVLLAARTASARVLSSIRTVRRSVWILGGAGAVAAVGALAFALWPAETSEGTSDSTDSIALTLEPADEVGTERELPSEPEEDRIEPHGEETRVEESLEALLIERERCLESNDIECLDQIVMAGTLLYNDDATGSPQWRAPQTLEVRIDQHLGDAVIAQVITDEQPASVLAVNTEAGWRLREIWLA